MHLSKHNQSPKSKSQFLTISAPSISYETTACPQAATDNISFATQFQTISTNKLGFSPGFITKRFKKYDAIYGKAADMVTSIS